MNLEDFEDRNIGVKHLKVFLVLLDASLTVNLRLSPTCNVKSQQKAELDIVALFGSIPLLLGVLMHAKSRQGTKLDGCADR